MSNKQYRVRLYEKHTKVKSGFPRGQCSSRKCWCIHAVQVTLVTLHAKFPVLQAQMATSGVQNFINTLQPRRQFDYVLFPYGPRPEDSTLASYWQRTSLVPS